MQDISAGLVLLYLMIRICFALLGSIVKKELQSRLNVAMEHFQLQVQGVTRIAQIATSAIIVPKVQQRRSLVLKVHTVLWVHSLQFSVQSALSVQTYFKKQFKIARLAQLDHCVMLPE